MLLFFLGGAAVGLVLRLHREHGEAGRTVDLLRAAIQGPTRPGAGSQEEQLQGRLGWYYDYYTVV